MKKFTATPLVPDQINRNGDAFTKEAIWEALDRANAPKHCDDYITDYDAPGPLRYFLLVHRLPAAEKELVRRYGKMPRLFADYQGRRVRVTMASRMGDVGITYNLDQSNGYGIRVDVAALENFSRSKRGKR